LTPLEPGLIRVEVKRWRLFPSRDEVLAQLISLGRIAAGLLLTTECLVVEKKEEEPAPAGGPPAGAWAGGIRVGSR
jgi:hypothetical protein